MTAENTLLFKAKSELQNEITELLEIEAQFIEQQKLIITKKRKNLAAAIKNLSVYEKILEDAGEILKEESEILKNEEKLNKSDKDDLDKKSENQEKEEENIEASEKVTEKEKELIDKKSASIRRALRDVKERLKLDEKTQELIERYNELHDSFIDNVSEAEAELKLRIYGSVPKGEPVFKGGLLANLLASIKDPTHAAKVGQRVRDRIARPWKMSGAVMQGAMAAPGFAARAIGGFFGFGLKKPKADDLSAAGSTESKKNEEASNNTIQFKKPGEKNTDDSSGEVLSKSEIIESRQDTQAFREKVLYYLSIISQTTAATAKNKKPSGQGSGDENQSDSDGGSLLEDIANIALASQLIPKKLKGLWLSFKRFFKKTGIKAIRLGRYLKGLPGVIKLAAGVGTVAAASSVAASAASANAAIASSAGTAKAVNTAANTTRTSVRAASVAATSALSKSTAAVTTATKGATGAISRVAGPLGVLADGVIGWTQSEERFGDNTLSSKMASGLGTIAGGSGRGIGEGSAGEVAINAGFNAMKYAAIGAMVGSVVPGIGNVVGGIAGGVIGLATGLIGGNRFAESSKALTDWATGEDEARKKRNAALRKLKKMQDEANGVKDPETLRIEKAEQEKLNKLNKFKDIHKPPAAELDKTKSDINKKLSSLNTKKEQAEKITKKSAEKPAVKPPIPPAKQNDKKTNADKSPLTKPAQKPKSNTVKADATKKSSPAAVATKPSAKKPQPSKPAKITSKDFSAAELAKFDKFITGNEKEGLSIAEYIDKYGAEKFMHSFTNKLSDEEMNKHFGLDNAKEQEFNKQAAKFGGPTVAQRRMMELSQTTGFTKKVYDIKKKKQNLVSTSPSKPSAPVNKSTKSAPKAVTSNSSTNNGTKEIVKAINSQKSVAFVQQSKANYVTGTALPVNG